MKKILVVEDNKDLSAILKRRLEHSGFSVDVVEDGYAFLSYLKAGQEPDVVVLDLMLPGRSGIELLGTLTSSWEAARVYIFSAHPEYKDRHGLQNYDIAGYFSKSDGMEKLIETIKADLEGTV